MNKTVLLALTILSFTANAQKGVNQRPTRFNVTAINETSPPRCSPTKPQPKLNFPIKDPTDQAKTETFDQGGRTTRYQFRTGAFASYSGAGRAANTPFWLRTIQSAVIPKGPLAVQLQGSIHTGYRYSQTVKFVSFPH